MVLVRSAFEPGQFLRVRVTGALSTRHDQQGIPMVSAHDGNLPEAYLRVVYEMLSRPDPQRSVGLQAGIQFQQGLTDSECAAVEEVSGFRFPPDLRSFLQFALPIGPGFPNWRIDRGGEAQWAEAMIAEAFPDTPELAAKAPRMIRVYSHRYLPDRPNAAGNPVFSAMGIDVIWYGYDLADYFHQEFGVPLPPWATRQPRVIEYWDGLIHPAARVALARNLASGTDVR